MIDELKDQYTVKTLCDVLEFPRSTYYDSKNKQESNRDRENKELTEKIKEIHLKSSERYGAPKIHKVLKKAGYEVSEKRVQRLMKKAGIRSKITKKYRPQNRKVVVADLPNIIKQDFATTSINEKWVADITYIHTTKDGWCYLASVMDLHSKKIIGYSFSRNMTTELVIKAFDNAYSTQ